MMNTAERDRTAYALARNYLLTFEPIGITPALLEEYLNPKVAQLRPKTLPGVYERLLGAAQSPAMRPAVIGGAIGGIRRLRSVLCDFHPVAVLDKYTEWSQVLDDIERDLKPRGKIRRTPRSVWPSFCRTVLSGAAFLAQFSDAEDFYGWADAFDRDERSRPALPMVLSFEIHGFGFPVACDFLKEVGYFNFAKPDVHLKAIFKGLELCAPNANDYQVFKAIIRVARSQGVTPFNVDKLFWLVGSGFFHEHTDIGREGRVGTDRAEFIRMAREELGLEQRIP